MPVFKSISDLVKYANKMVESKVNEVLLDEVTNEVKVEEVNNISIDVYGRPTSGAYKRRYYDGGFGDEGNINGRLEGNGMLVVSNDTPFNPYLNGVGGELSDNAGRGEGLDGLIDYGDGWNGIHYDWAACGPTRYAEHTKQNLKASGAIKKAMKEGLQERGLDVK